MSKYVIWDSLNGPSLHGPFGSDEAAIEWAWHEGIALGLISDEIQPDSDYYDAQSWYDQEPDVWVREVLAP